MNKSLFKSLAGLSIGLLAMGCSSTAVITAPPISYTNTSPRISELSESQTQRWGHLDLIRDTVPGMSVDRAYDELLQKRKGQTVIVGVIDSGIDLDHEDIKDVLWVNEKEKPGDGIDNDGNGYIDDIHGYNFLGESYHEQLEIARIIRLKIGDEAYQAAAQTELDTKLPEAKAGLPQLQQIEQFVSMAHQNIQKELGKEYYSIEDLEKYSPKTPQEEQLVGVLIQVMGMGQDIPSALADLNDGINYYKGQVDYHLNVNFDGRKPVGDDPYDINDRNYGNGNPSFRDEDESHGTHVAGIIAATRGNMKGVDGVAKNVKIMSIRTVPDGDEYDKDVALAIRYAADNGAKVINASFGKGFSPNAEWVYDALAYAASKDVLFVHAAGNDGADLDSPENPNFPNDHKLKNTPEIVDNVITVGALTSSFGPEMVASFSNYGKQNVDVFAPGDAIYSSMPNNDYEFQGGTSMAAPAVAGIAALIRSYFPKLSAVQVKQIIMNSGIAPQVKVNIGGPEGTEKSLDELSRSGKIANLYNAIILANQVSRGEVTL
ncbi:S8 family peptidase [Algoriphagus boritolerans]|uniref:Subtilase family protein n=1 Tax=Algoriphagus boritolerans DSM 17298 = JCM 18970 TaxID=1120964 RepID=A0A1H5YPV5_9BACT|nr:S8 family peptidase [Algoriphagus boritolerans]SEG25567.1 Subtilase family protein [Algoriphagus boritolerans DSM 17298 = JCM 18970]